MPELLDPVIEGVLDAGLGRAKEEAARLQRELRGPEALGLVAELHRVLEWCALAEDRGTLVSPRNLSRLIRLLCLASRLLERALGWGWWTKASRRAPRLESAGECPLIEEDADGRLSSHPPPAFQPLVTDLLIFPTKRLLPHTARLPGLGGRVAALAA